MEAISPLVEKIAEAAKDKRIEGIGDLRDESDRDGMRIYVELKRDINRLQEVVVTGMTGIPAAGRAKTGIGAPGKTGRAVFAFYSPRPPLGSLTKEMG